MLGCQAMVNMNSLKLKHNRPLKVTIILLLSLVVSTPILFLQPAAAQSTDYYEKTFEWDYNGKHWTWNLSIPVALYDAYHDVPDARRTRDGPAGYGFLTTTKDYYVNMLAQKLNETTSEMGYGSFDQVSFVLAFVQSLPYTSDSVTTQYDEYPRFPIETLVDDGGDCEDTSILFASLTLILGYGTVYISPPDHYAVGILGNNLKGTYWEYPEASNKTYYYCETTGNNFKIGQLPQEFSGQNAYIYPIDENKQFVPATIVVPTVQATPTDAPITTSTAPTPQSTPKGTPGVTDPNLQQVKPLSFNLISENPALFILIVFAIVGSIGIAIWSAKRPKLKSEPQTTPPPPEAAAENLEEQPDKYCIYCGSGNKDYAAFCEKCGKQIKG